MKIENLQLILKTVERCNIACTYCYYFFGGDDSYKERPSVMKIAVIDEIVKYIEESYSYYKFKNVWISLHGGEPMLQSIDSVYSMCSKLAQLKNIGINVIFSIQTNGTLINDEWISLFEKYDFSVGVSIDGPKSINDQYRIDKKGRSTYERLESGIFKLNEAVRLGRIQDVSSISVINPKFCYKKIFNHLTEILKIKNINFLLPDVSYERGLPEGTTAEDFGRVLLEIFHEWVGKEQVNVRYIKELLKNFQVYRYSNESFFEQIKKFQIVVIHSDGETSPDDSLIPAISWYKDEGKEKLNVSSLRYPQKLYR